MAAQPLRLDPLAIRTRKLDELATLYAQHERKTHELAVAIGRELIGIRSALPRGEWTRWLRQRPFAIETAYRFIRMAEFFFSEENPAGSLPPELGLKAADEYIREHRAAARRGRKPYLVPTPVELPPSLRVEVGDARRLPLDDGAAQLVVTSPPFNAGMPYDGYDDWLPFEDYWHGLIEPSVREAYRVLSHGGRLCLNMPNVLSPNAGGDVRPGSMPASWHGKLEWSEPDSPWSVILIPRLWALLESLGFLPREHLTWVKGEPDAVRTTSTAWGTFGSPSNPVLRAVAEPIFVASKGTHRREPSPSDLSADDFKLLTRNVWFVPANTPDLGHPSMFPEEIPARCIRLWCYPGDLVVDPFCGTGTTGVAAKRLGRSFFGVDVGANYVATARARIAATEVPQ